MEALQLANITGLKKRRDDSGTAEQGEKWEG